LFKYFILNTTPSERFLPRRAVRRPSSDALSVDADAKFNADVKVARSPPRAAPTRNVKTLVQLVSWFPNAPRQNTRKGRRPNADDKTRKIKIHYNSFPTKVKKRIVKNLEFFKTFRVLTITSDTTGKTGRFFTPRRSTRPFRVFRQFPSTPYDR